MNEYSFCGKIAFVFACKTIRNIKHDSPETSLFDLTHMLSWLQLVTHAMGRFFPRTRHSQKIKEFCSQIHSFMHPFSKVLKRHARSSLNSSKGCRAPSFWTFTKKLWFWFQTFLLRFREVFFIYSVVIFQYLSDRERTCCCSNFTGHTVMSTRGCWMRRCFCRATRNQQHDESPLSIGSVVQPSPTPRWLIALGKIMHRRGANHG